uniref:cilia- and flagella-associated protein 299 isoform X4 n=1 Tax=Halichoerus grypus TaxID=9711 RepID=UPI001658E3AB|nr:cilia- and flagella-associated protein 299 isoform X4 [Halichoerus grypus]
MDQDEGLTAVDNIVTQFNTYEDFLDSQITTVDLYYLEDEGLARQLVELGYRGTGEVVKREDFEARKAAIEIARLAERTQKKGAVYSRGSPAEPALCPGFVQKEWCHLVLETVQHHLLVGGSTSLNGLKT